MDKILSPIKERVLKYVEYKGIAKETFFSELGISYSNFKGKGAKSELGSDKVVQILTNYSEINPEWLLMGSGSMLKDMSIDEVNKTLPIYNNVDYKEKYYEALEGYHQVNEENRELRLKIDKQAKELEKLKETHQKQVKEIENCKKELEKFRKSKNSTTMLPV